MHISDICITVSLSIAIDDTKNVNLKHGKMLNHEVDD